LLYQLDIDILVELELHFVHHTRLAESERVVAIIAMFWCIHWIGKFFWVHSDCRKKERKKERTEEVTYL